MTATLEKPESPKLPTDQYLWQSWHQANAYLGSLDPNETMRALCAAAEGWKSLSMMVVKKKKFSDAVLLAMRGIMDLPEPYPEYWKHNPAIDPTQDWVADQIREFVKWHLQKLGEPKETLGGAPDGAPK